MKQSWLKSMGVLSLTSTGSVSGPPLRANVRLLPQQSLYSCEEGTFRSPEGLGIKISLLAFAPCRLEDTSCFRSMVICVGSETPYKKLVMATLEGQSWLAGLVIWLFRQESRLPLDAREVQFNSTLGFGSLLDSSAGLNGRKRKKRKTQVLSGPSYGIQHRYWTPWSTYGKCQLQEPHAPRLCLGSKSHLILESN